MIRAAHAQNAPEEFLKTSGSEFKKKSKSLSSIGVESDIEAKNYNPNLKLRG